MMKMTLETSIKSTDRSIAGTFPRKLNQTIFSSTCKKVQLCFGFLTSLKKMEGVTNEANEQETSN